MTRNTTIILGALAFIAIGAGGYWIYQDQQRNTVGVNIGGRSITLETR